MDRIWLLAEFSAASLDGETHVSEEVSNVFRATFDESGFPTGFYPSEFWPDGYPETAVEITEAQYDELRSNQGQRRFIGDEIVVVEPTAASPTITDYENAIQSLVDSTAREKQFRDGVTLASYTASTKAKWAAEAQAFVAWRDNVWFYAYGQLAKVQAGERSQPTVEQFLAEIAPIAWPVA